MEPPTIDRLQTLLKGYQQEQLLRFWGDLSSSQRVSLAEQIDNVDFELINRLCTGEEVAQDFTALAARAQSPTAYRLNDSTLDAADARDAATQALSDGKLGVILVAGGQGTRLGFPHPKGMFQLGPLSNRSLFQIHIDQLLAVATRYGVSLPLYLMTSPATHNETIQFLRAHDNFGLPDEDLHVFCQGTMPAVGRIEVESICSCPKP